MIYIIVNNLHLKGKRAQKKLEIVKGVFAHAGKEVTVLGTDHSGHAAEYAKTITSDGQTNTIVAMGGDGTLHEILNGFCDFGHNFLGLIPFGTGNDFAAALNIPADVKEAAELIAFREPTKIDYIQLGGGLRSMNAVGMGIDVEVLKRVYGGKRHGKTKYLRSLIASLFKFKSIDFTASVDGGIEQHHHGLIAALGNGRQIGGGIKLFPEARPDDGYMDLIIVDYISRPKLIAALIKLMRGKVNSIKEAHVCRCKKASFKTQDDCAIQAEGEIYHGIPIEAELIPAKLKFYL